MMKCSFCGKKEEVVEGKDPRKFVSRRSNICLRCMSLVRQDAIAARGTRS